MKKHYRKIKKTEGVPEKEVVKFFKGCYNKRFYTTRKKAEDFAEHQFVKFGVRSFSYECNYCHNYHLTTHKK